jgi:hypothetical protein
VIGLKPPLISAHLVKNVYYFAMPRLRNYKFRANLITITTLPKLEIDRG